VKKILRHRIVRVRESEGEPSSGAGMDGKRRRLSDRGRMRMKITAGTERAFKKKKRPVHTLLYLKTIILRNALTHVGRRLKETDRSRQNGPQEVDPDL